MAMYIIEDLVMPPFSRTVWASKKMKDLWEPRLVKARALSNLLEHETVARGLRSCSTAHIKEEQMEEKSQELASRGLLFVPIIKTADYNGASGYHPPVVDGMPWNWYGAVSNNPEDGLKFYEASKGKADHKVLGRLLGYPDCCIDFVSDNTFGRTNGDFTWEQAEATDLKARKKNQEHLIKLRESTFLTNTMLRTIGIKVVPHIPCSHDCKHTQEMAEKWMELARELDPEAAEYLEQFLGMPVEWDALKGIAYISTPLFKIETNTVACYPNYVVQREGTFYPENAPGGLKFPWTEAWKFHGLSAMGHR